MTDQELFREARKMLTNAYAPYSGFRVGAALLTKDGKVFTGVNVENSSFGATICAERTAIVKAVSEGYHEFEAIAVATSSGSAFPCGICRQFIFEFGDFTRVIVGESENDLVSYEIRDLLPKGFRL
jgi:cytidine deaminase